MPYTLNKLHEIRNQLDHGDVLGACKPLNELIERYERMWLEYRRIRFNQYEQHSESVADAGMMATAGTDAPADSEIFEGADNGREI